MSKKQIVLFVVAAILCVCAGGGCIAAIAIVGRATDDATRAFGLVVMCLVFCLCLAAGGTLWYAGENRWKAKSHMLIDKDAFTLIEYGNHGSDDQSSAAIPVTATTLSSADVEPNSQSGEDVGLSSPMQTTAVTASTLVSSGTQMPS